MNTSTFWQLATDATKREILRDALYHPELLDTYKDVSFPMLPNELKAAIYDSPEWRALGYDAEGILKVCCQRAYNRQATGIDTNEQVNIALGILWDARKYLGCYPDDIGKVAVPGLYANMHFEVRK